METADEILNAALDILGVTGDSRKNFDARYQGDVLSVRVHGGERVDFPSTDRVAEVGGIVWVVVRELKHRGFDAAKK